MKGNVIPTEQIDYLLTDEELYVMTLKRYFRYASGVNDKLSTKDEFKYWLVNQMKLEFTEQDYEIFWTATMNNQDVTEDSFIDLCRNGRHYNDEDITVLERKLAEEGKSEIRNTGIPRVFVPRNKYHYVADLPVEKTDTSFMTEIGSIKAL